MSAYRNGNVPRKLPEKVSSMIPMKATAMTEIRTQRRHSRKSETAVSGRKYAPIA